MDDYTLRVEPNLDGLDELEPRTLALRAEPTELRALVNEFRLLTVTDSYAIKWMCEQQIQREDSRAGLARTWVSIEAMKPLMNTAQYRAVADYALTKLRRIEREIEREAARLVKPNPPNRQFVGAIEI